MESLCARLLYAEFLCEYCPSRSRPRICNTSLDLASSVTRSDALWSHAAHRTRLKTGFRTRTCPYFRTYFPVDDVDAADDVR